MKKSLFEMGAKFEDGWSSDNRTSDKKIEKEEIKEPSKHRLHFAKERRRGKIVTIIKPFYLTSKDMKSYLKILKRELGVGGTIKDMQIELQGEVSSDAKEILQKIGFKF